MGVKIPSERMVAWLSQMVQIPSINPDGGEPISDESWVGEGKMGTFVAQAFADLGGDVEFEEVLPGRHNVYGRWAGRSERWVVLDVHMDTVGVEQMTDPPFDGRVEDGKVWGRGSVDTKASLALILALLEVVQAEKLEFKHNLLVLASVGEEFGGDGARVFNTWAQEQGLDIAEIIVAEPTLCAPIYAHKGLFSLRLRVDGVPAHSSQPHLGKNAITAAAKIVAAVEQEHERLQAAEAKTAVGNGTIAVTLIDGGSGHNIIPEACTVHINRRLAPFENADDEIARVVALAREATSLPVEVELALGLPAFYQAPECALVQDIAQWTGTEPTIAPYATNAACYPELGEQMVIFGPGSIDQAHGTTEWIEIAEMEKAVGVYCRWLLGE